MEAKMSILFYGKKTRKRTYRNGSLNLNTGEMLSIDSALYCSYQLLATTADGNLYHVISSRLGYSNLSGVIGKFLMRFPVA